MKAERGLAATVQCPLQRPNKLLLLSCEYFNGTVSTEPVATGRLNSVSEKEVTLRATVLRDILSSSLQLRVKNTVSGHVISQKSEISARQLPGSNKARQSFGISLGFSPSA